MAEAKVKKIFFVLGGAEYQSAKKDYDQRMQGKSCQAFHSKAQNDVSGQMVEMFQKAGFSAKADFEPVCFDSGFHHPRINFDSVLNRVPTEDQAREIIQKAMEEIPFVSSVDMTVAHKIQRAKTPVIA
jgi:hypothetical protein